MLCCAVPLARPLRYDVLSFAALTLPDLLRQARLPALHPRCAALGPTRLTCPGSTIIALNGPEESSVTTILAFQSLFLAPGFLVFGSVVILASLGLVFFVAPKFVDRPQTR